MSKADIDAGRTNHDPPRARRALPADDPLDRQSAVRTPGLVLIAEDEEPIAETLAIIVVEAGYTPLLAPHGREALELALRRRPSLVITDVMMPYLDGFSLIAALREEAEQHGADRVPVIVMTAAGADRAREAGADAVLSKPFELEEIEALLRRFLEPPAQVAS